MLRDMYCENWGCTIEILRLHHTQSFLVLKLEYFGKTRSILNTIVADALAPCVARSSAAMVFRM